jgi:hypothetical protein
MAKIFAIEKALRCNYIWVNRFSSIIERDILNICEVGLYPANAMMNSKGDIAMSRTKYAFLALVLLLSAGCNKTSQENAAQPQSPAATPPASPPAEQPQSAPESAQQSTVSNTGSPAITAAAQNQKAPASASDANRAVTPASTTETNRAKAAATAPRSELAPSTGSSSATAVASKVAEPKYATLAGGSRLPVRLQTPLDSSLNKSGDIFSAILDKDLVVDGDIVAPRGSAVDGKVTHVERSGRLEGRAAMSLQLTSIMVGDKAYPLQTEILALQADSTKKQDAKKVGIGAGLGAAIGAIAGGGKGAAIGAAVGCSDSMQGIEI